MVLVIPWWCLSWNLTVGRLIPALHLQTSSAIAGAVAEAAPPLSLKAILSDSYQQWISRAVGRLPPMFAPAVRWKNQLYYTFMGTAGSNRVIVGRRGQLLELPYLVEYCSRDLDALRTKGEAWAAGIRKMQDYFDARGQRFLYLITPSKVAQNPEIIPEGYVCPARDSDRREKLKSYDEILTRHGVRFVDAASYLAAVSKDYYPMALFPRGGTHWNGLAAALAAQKVIAAVDAQQPEPLFATLSFAWHVSYAPAGSDRDLLDLMNLPYPDAHYPVPELTYRSVSPSQGCHAVAMTEVGGSFMYGLNDILAKLDCPPKIAFWFYWNYYHVDPAVLRRSLLDAQVILFEENDSVAPGSSHGQLMMQEVSALASTATASASPKTSQVTRDP